MWSLFSHFWYGTELEKKNSGDVLCGINLSAKNLNKYFLSNTVAVYGEFEKIQKEFNEKSINIFDIEKEKEKFDMVIYNISCDETIVPTEKAKELLKTVISCVMDHCVHAPSDYIDACEYELANKLCTFTIAQKYNNFFNVGSIKTKYIDENSISVSYWVVKFSL